MKKFYILIISLLPLLNFAQKSPNEWTVVATYEIPGKSGGLTYDGTYLYSGLYSSPGDDNLIYQIDPSNGDSQLLCVAPQEQSYGLSFDGTYFWSTDRQGSYDPALAVQFDYDGNLLTSFELPATYISGIEYMSDGTFWVCAYYDPDGTAFHVDASGNVLGQFVTPNLQPWAICQMDDLFWIADYNANMLYLVDETGLVIESHESVGQKPTGIVYDGQYLWYTTGPSQAPSTLYKVDLGGSGNPILDIQPQEFNIGSVLAGSNQEIQLTFENTGGSTGIFTKESLTGTGSNKISLNNLPDVVEVEAGMVEGITADMDFNSPGIFDVIQLFSTNDPLNTEIEIHFFGEITHDGPVLETNISQIIFSNVRKFASTRRFIQLINTGNSNLTIDEISFGNPAFYADESQVFPLQIASLDTIQFGVWFHPLWIGDFSNEMIISTNDPDSPLTIEISASAVEHDNSIGSLLWNYQITTGYDQSPKAMLGIADVNGDQAGDLIVCSEDNMIRCLNGNSSGTADELWRTEIYSGSVYQQNGISSIGDANDDGFEDFIVGTTGGDRSVVCLSGKTGEIIWKFQTNEVGLGGWVYQVYGEKDLNNDGIRDALAAVGDDSNDQGPKCIYLIDGATGSKIWRAPLNGPGFAVLAIEDFTGDGNIDVLAGASNESETQGKAVGINGQNGQIMWTFPTQGTSVWGLAQLGDINNDEIPDVMAGDFAGHFYFLDASNGNVLENGSIGNNLILRLLPFDDINEDGFQDILISSSSINTYLIDGFSSEAIWSVPLSDKSWNLAVSNDLNQDGFKEVMAGTLYSNNYSYFLDGSNGDELSKKAASAAIDALIGIDDVCRDYTMEMVVGDRNGQISCYSGGLDGTVGISDEIKSEKKANFSLSPNPVTEEFIMLINWPKSEKVSMEIIENGSGRSWDLGEMTFLEGEQQIQYKMPSSLKDILISGLYFIRLTGMNEQQQQKILYLKK